MSATQKLLLFDIDGTLLHTGGAGISALYAGLVDAFNLLCPLEQMPPIELAGATDAGLARYLFDHFDIDHSPENKKSFYEAYHLHLDQNLSEHARANGGKLLPGVHPLLQTLSKHDHLALGLLTGNIQQGAWTKLEHFEIAHFFDVGAFGDDHHDRNHLGPIALERASTHFGRDFSPTETMIIGDTPKDIACARACGACAIAVATGNFSLEILATHEPDHLFESFEDGSPFLEAIGL